MTSTPTLVKSIGLRQAIALYVSALLGAGVLVLPGQVASMAGPASLLAWGFSCLLGIPLAIMFAHLSRAYPSAGGVSTYVSTAFGSTAGGVTGWWYFVAGSVGQAIVPLTGGYYVATALGVDQRWGFVVAVLVLALAVGANLLGARVSAAAQVVLAVGVGAILVVAILAAVPRMDVGELVPFAPHGVAGVGQAVVVLFFAFAGWEAVAHLAEEFKDSDRDLIRATTATITIISVLYLGIAAAVVLTGSYGSPELDRVAVGSLLSGAFGNGASAVAAVAAVVICLGTTNAFITATSRLGFALARDQWLPAAVAATSRGVPVGSVLLVGGVAGASLGVAALMGWGTEELLIVPSTLVMLVYIAAAAAGIRLLTGGARTCATITIVLTLVVLPSALHYLAVPAMVTLLAVAYRRWRSTRTVGS